MFLEILLTALSFVPQDQGAQVDAQDLATAAAPLVEQVHDADLGVDEAREAHGLEGHAHSADEGHEGHVHSTGGSSPTVFYPVLWTHGCGWTAWYDVCPGVINWFRCYGCGHRFSILG